MKTARYSNKSITNDKHIPIQISLGSPKFKLQYTVNGKMLMLAPQYSLLRENNKIEYQRKYIERLEHIGVDRIKDALSSFSQEGKEIVLLCFEDVTKDGNWCHRRMFADWYELKTGEKIDELEELSSTKPDINRKSIQLTLF